MLAFIWLLLSGVALAQISFNVTTTGTAITMAPGSVLTAANGTTVLNGTYTIMYSSGADTGTFYVGVNVSNQPVCYYSSGITLSNWAVSGFAGGTCTSGSPPTNIYTVAISIVAGAVGSAPTQYQPITNQSITEGAGIIVMNNTQVVCADATGSSIGCIEPDGVTCSVSAGVLTCNEGGVIYGGGNLTITGGVPYQNGTAATVTSDAGFKISSDILTLGTNSGSSGGVVLNGNTSTNSASLGTELTTSGGCSGTGWGGTYPNYTAPGTTQALTCNLTGGTVTNDSYQTLITITGYSAGTLTCAVGGATFAVFAANNTTAYGPKATGTGALVCTPTSTFASGTGVSVSVKQISPITTYTYFTTDSGGNLGVGAILQQTASLNNYFFGGGTYNTTGSDNTSLGRGSMFANTTGADNTSVGTGAMSSNTTGVQNVAVGAEATTRRAGTWRFRITPPAIPTQRAVRSPYETARRELEIPQTGTSPSVATPPARTMWRSDTRLAIRPLPAMPMFPAATIPISGISAARTPRPSSATPFASGIRRSTRLRIQQLLETRH
jgi:hypothetical protein